MPKVQYYTCPVGHPLAPSSEPWTWVAWYHCDECGKAYNKLAQLVLKLITI